MSYVLTKRGYAIKNERKKGLAKTFETNTDSTAWSQDGHGKIDTCMVKGITPNIACSNVPKRKKVLVPIQCSHLHFPHFKNKELEKAQIMAKIMTKQKIRTEIAILWTKFHI